MASEILGGGTQSYRLSTQDATFIYAESQNGPLHIGSIGMLEGGSISKTSCATSKAGFI